MARKLPAQPIDISFIVNEKLQAFDETALVGISRCHIKELAGFDNKLHSVPDKHDARSDSFVAKIAAVDVEKDIEAIFQRLKKIFKFKRVDLKVSTPDPGWGAIETPHFTYSIHANLCEKDPSKVLLERSIREIKNSDVVGIPEFASAFDMMFDRIEFSFTQPIEMENWIDNIEAQEDDLLELNYDSNLTNCSLKIAGISATIHVDPEKFCVVHPSLAPTQQILASYLQAVDAVNTGLQ